MSQPPSAEIDDPCCLWTRDRADDLRRGQCESFDLVGLAKVVVINMYVFNTVWWTEIIYSVQAVGINKSIRTQAPTNSGLIHKEPQVNNDSGHHKRKINQIRPPLVGVRVSYTEIECTAQEKTTRAEQ